MDRKIVFLYSGQGAQYFNMARELYEQDPTFQKWMRAGNDIARPLLYTNLIEMIFDGSKSRGEPFDNTAYTHPAIFMLAYALTQVLRERGIQPDMVLGYSLGEFTAAAVSGAMGFEDGMRLVTEKGILIEDSTPVATMMAILAEPEMMSREPDLFVRMWPACFNFREHFVVTGYRGDIETLASELERRKVICQILPVSHGFHSPLVDAAEREFLQLDGPTMPPALPVFSCLRRGQASSIDLTHLWQATRGQVQFSETLAKLEESGPHDYIDVGPAGTLATFAKYNLPTSSASRTHVIIDPFGRNLTRLAKLEEALATAAS